MLPVSAVWLRLTLSGRGQALGGHAVLLGLGWGWGPTRSSLGGLLAGPVPRRPYAEGSLPPPVCLFPGGLNVLAT